MEMLRLQWIVCIILLAEFLRVTVTCPSDTCAIINSNETSIATQVINLLKERPDKNDSFTFYIQPGIYNATNGTRTIFYNFSNIILQKDPEFSGEVIIQCPNFTDVGDFNSIGFFNSSYISIIGLMFTKCGQKAFGAYFENVSNVYIFDSTFYRNRNNGVGIRSGTNVTVINCTFEGSVGLQNDSINLLVQNVSYIFGGAGLGIALQDTTNTTITVENCTFRDNVALRSISDSDIRNDSRPYNNLQYGNGGGVYIHMSNVTGVTVRIKNCHFYNNTALHQGGAIAAFIIASLDNKVEVVDCDFIGSKAIGYPLFNQLGRTIADYSTFIAEINSNFSVRNFNTSIRDALLHVPSLRIQETGGFGGAIIANFFRGCEHNKLIIRRSTFKESIAVGSAGVGVFMWNELSNIHNGMNTNRAWISGCQFFDNHVLLGGSAIGFLSRTRIDIQNLPTVIKNCQFKENTNEGDMTSSLFRFGVNGAISTVRTPLTFLGVNHFDSNVGGCITINNAKLDINATMNFTYNRGTPLGGAIRTVGLSLIQLFPSTNMIFTGNSAQRFGGAIGIDNVRVEEDLQSILNYNCFLQYNVGGEDEFCPSHWKAKTSFDNNKASLGYSVYAEDISRCISTPCFSNNKSNDHNYENSLFSLSNTFEDLHDKANSDFGTAPFNFLVDKTSKTMSVFPGEEFILSLKVLDQNDNEEVGFFMYPSNTFFTEADVIEIDLTTGNQRTSFGVVSGSSDQKSSLVVRNSPESFSFRNHNKTIIETKFTLNLLDSSTGNAISKVEVTAKLRSCHFLYNYNSSRGNCQFIRNHARQILRSDNISTYFYIKSELYGELDNDSLRTARIPSFYQFCGREGGLTGCLVKYDDPYEQCSEGRNGFLCGKCPHGSENEVQGLAFNLLECVSCETGDRILFVFICIFIVVISIIIMYYNIGLPNSLRGFLFYSQMIGYVYVSGARSGTLNWDFFLSRVFGFSFYFPICLARMEALQVVSFGFLPPTLILMSVICYTILARRITPLSNKKTLDGIWFLILIAYVYTFDTCFNLLRCTASTVHSDDFSEIEFHSLVYFYDGSVTCYEDEHIIYAVISILVLLTFVIPFPFMVVAISRNYFKKAGPFCDVINTGIKPKFNWWSGYDLLRRLIFVALYFVIELTNIGDYTQFALALCAIIILLITSRIHPYNKWIVNLIECTILLDLVLIAAYFLNTDRSVTGSGFATFLFVLPYIYMLIYVVIKCIRKMKLVKKCRRAGVLPISIEFPRNMFILHVNNTTEENEESVYIREALIYDD